MSVVRKLEAARILRQLPPHGQAAFLESFWQNLTLHEKAALWIRYVTDASPHEWVAEQDLLHGELAREGGDVFRDVAI